MNDAREFIERLRVAADDYERADKGGDDAAMHDMGYAHGHLFREAAAALAQPTAAPLPLPERLNAEADAITCYASTTIDHPPNRTAILLREAAAALAQRDGIPREPTIEMLSAAADTYAHPANRKLARTLFTTIWQAMLDAAPTGIPRDDARDAARFRAWRHEWSKASPHQREVMIDAYFDAAMQEGQSNSPEPKA
jgi:hypothetical protein